MICVSPPFQEGYEGKTQNENIVSGNYRVTNKCFPHMSKSLKHLLWRLFHPNPADRITLPGILEHTWIKDNAVSNTEYITAVRECYTLPEVQRLLRMRRRPAETPPPTLDSAASSSAGDILESDTLCRMDSTTENECRDCFEALRRDERGLTRGQLKTLIFGEGGVCETTQRMLNKVFNLMRSGSTSDGDDGLVEFEQFKLFYQTASPSDRTSFSVGLSMETAAAVVAVVQEEEGCVAAALCDHNDDTHQDDGYHVKRPRVG
jgi:serine/threonine protein kinase